LYIAETHFCNKNLSGLNFNAQLDQVVIANDF
jgi:hypothetical protein